MFTKSCAAWPGLILAISPFMALWCARLECRDGPDHRHDAGRPTHLEEWFVGGGATLDFPVPPAAGEFKLASLALLGAADFVEMDRAASFDAPPVAAIPIGRAPTLTALRLRESPPDRVITPRLQRPTAACV